MQHQLRVNLPPAANYLFSTYFRKENCLFRYQITNANYSVFSAKSANRFCYTGIQHYYLLQWLIYRYRISGRTIYCPGIQAVVIIKASNSTKFFLIRMLHVFAHIRCFHVCHDCIYDLRLRYSIVVIHGSSRNRSQHNCCQHKNR